MQAFIDDEKLISLVESNECLYNKFSSAYKFSYAKDAIWKKIANELDASEEQCRRRWTTLRDHYARECRRLQMPSESGAHSIERWPLFDALKFLKNHVKARRTPGASDICLECPSSPPPKLNVSCLASSPDEVPSLPLATMRSRLKTSQKDPLEISLSNETLPLDTTSKPNVRKKKRNTSDIIDKEFHDAVCTFKRTCMAREAGVRNETVHGFGKMICGVICDMSAEKQVRAMQSVTEIVMQIRLEPDK